MKAPAPRTRAAKAMLSVDEEDWPGFRVAAADGATVVVGEIAGAISD